MTISDISIRRPVFATVISLMLVILGLVSLTRIAVREFPEVDPVFVSVSTDYRGAGAAIVENKITQVIEDRIAGLEGIEALRSSSRDGRSAINIEFSADRDVDAAANDVRDRVGRVLDDLPEEASPPEIQKSESGPEAIMFLNLSSDRMSVLELTDFAERVLIDQLSAVPGVSRVNIGGERRQAVRIWIDRQALAARALTVADIENALRRENVELPAGRLESAEREFALRTDTGLARVEDFRRLALGRGPDGYVVRLGEVARVELAAENDRTVARTMGLPGIGLGIEQVSKANTLEVARQVRETAARIQPGLPEGTVLSVNFDRAVFIEASLREVEIALAISLTMVLLVIYLFLGNLRATLVPAVTIPVSIIATFLFMDAMGYSVNVLTLLGMVLAIGLVVDDAIVVLENIFRRIEAGQKPLLAALDGSREIGFAVIATTLVLISVFVPISFLPGAIGRLFREFGFTLAAAVAFSCLIALTLTPAMASRMFREQERRNAFALRVDGFFRALARQYERRLRSLIRRPWLVVAGTLGLVVVAALAIVALPREFAPAEDRGAMRISLVAPEGSSLEYTERQMAAAEEILLRERERYGDIRRFSLRIGSGFGGATEVNEANGFIILEDWHDRERSAFEVAASLSAQLAQLPGVRGDVFTPQGLGSRGGRPVQVVIGGPDYDTLAGWSDVLLEAARANPGLTGVDTNYRERKPQLRVSVDRDRAAELGVSLETIGRTLETVLGSRVVTTYIDRGREYRVILQGQASDRATPSDLQNLYVRSTRGNELVPLANLITIEETAGPIQLNRFDRLRAVTISAGLAPGYTMGQAVAFFQDQVRERLPPAARLSFDGESREYLRTQGQLWTTFVFAIAIVFLVLAAQFESFKHPAVIMTTVPLAVIGAFVGLWIYNLFGARMSLNVFSQIAMIMLIGIAAKNGVLIVEFANQLRDRGVERVEAVVQAAAVRLRPVLMTSLCTAFGSLPLLLATGAGAEQREPIGVVVFFGTTISVFLTLFVVPAVYALVARSHRSPHYLAGLIERLRRLEPAPVSSQEGHSQAVEK
ncbi:MAG TPA: efflux RND transporter permease subunit [Steroidobacteraceae bacterium]|nr:efflux RND transporter permease subunit [Steroidobacteraceae bacterium]